MINTKEIRPVWAEVSLDAIKNNIQEVRRLTDPAALVTGVIKANGYGHGSVDIAKTLLANGADRLAVAALDEAIELRAAGITARILVLGYTGCERAHEVVAGDFDQCVYTLDVAQALSNAASKAGKNALVHIKIDSGMGRIGYLPTEESLEEIIQILQLPNITFSGIFTHFSAADETDKTYTRQQFDRFMHIVQSLEARGYKAELRHCANSATIIDLPEMHLDMVRAGIILYGLAPSQDVKLERINLMPAMTIKARITNLKTLAPGESISYGRKFTTAATSKIASLALGYADGFTRLLSGKAEVLINGTRAKVVGNIYMDQCMIDVSAFPTIAIGDEVVIFGHDEVSSLPCDEIANKLGTINYEVVCAVARRVPRVYVENNIPVHMTNYLSR